jgi:hypothetical protein
MIQPFKERSQGFARGTGMMMVVYIMVMNTALLAMLMMNLCNPTPMLDQLVETCKPRFTPEGIAIAMGSLTAAMGATTYGIYKENKKAETAQNGG